MAKNNAEKVSIFWFRRDLRLDDNAGLYHALKEAGPVLALFIFDSNILSKLEDKSDARVGFIYDTVMNLKAQLMKNGSDILVRYGKPLDVYKNLLDEYAIQSVYTNHDYEPYARERDRQIEALLNEKNIEFKTFKDQCLFEKDEVLTDARKPYTVFTPYKRKVLKYLNNFYLEPYPTGLYFKNFFKVNKKIELPGLKELGFEKSNLKIPKIELSETMLKKYGAERDFPSLEKGTSHLGIHLRFGTVSIRELAQAGNKFSQTWLSELIWRDFFMQILWHYPRVISQSYRTEYDNIEWRQSTADFKRWANGTTGYPMVDAGMRELNETGFMHNRVRMVTASFLCKHLLIHWSQGEKYFAKKLLDYDLSANNGNWQWAAGSGCDAAPYFRIFNPLTQAEKFDPDGVYIQKWVPEYGSTDYPGPMVEHPMARDRCLQAFTKAVKAGRA